MTGMLLPALNKARESAKGISCAGNLKQIGFVSAQYSADNNDYTLAAYPKQYLPWIYYAATYAPDRKLYSCPSEEPIAQNRWDDLLGSGGLKWDTFKMFSYAVYWEAFGYSPDHTNNYPIKATKLLAKNSTKLIQFVDCCPGWNNNRQNTRYYSSTAYSGDGTHFISNAAKLWPFESGSGNMGAARHNNSANVTFGDGHVGKIGNLGEWQDKKTYWSPYAWQGTVAWLN